MATTTAKPAAAGHRARLTEGLAAAIAEKGYAAVTIADVVRGARVSKRTFYEHFADKEACFLALYAETSDELLELIAAATAGAEGPWEARIGAAARAYFERVAGEPELIRAALLEIQAAGPRARVLRREVQRRYADQLRAFSEAALLDGEGVTALTPALATAVVGGLNELMLEAVEAGRAERIGELADAATELIRAVLARPAARAGDPA
jgi:AcrR family transcriptional regulator